MSSFCDISLMSPIRWLKINYTAPAQYNMLHFDDDWAIKVIPQYYLQKPYAQKWQHDNIIYHQFQSQQDPIRLEVYNCKGERISGADQVATVVTTSISTSIFNVYQINQALNTLPSGYYFLVLKIGASDDPQYISECIDLKTVHPDTRLFQYKNSYNRQSMIFENNFEPEFRVEASIEEFSPMCDDKIYIDQSRNAVTLSSFPYRAYDLKVGASYGIPDWIIDKLNRIMGNDSVKIDGKLYVKSDGAKWKPKRETLYPWVGWSLDIQEAMNKSAIRFDEDPGISSDEIMITFNFETAGYGDFDGPASSNIIQVTKIG